MDSQARGAGRTEVLLGALLAAVAGSVDALVFTHLGHVFASVVTGNLVVLGLSAGQRQLTTLLHVVTSIGCYSAGVLIGGLGLRRSGGPARWRRPTTLVCAGELLVLLCCAAIWLLTAGTPHAGAEYTALAAAALAMGLQSAAFRLVDLPGVTTTYFTGTLTALLIGVVTDGRVNRAALVALVALVAGAAAAGLLAAHAATYAVLLPVGLLVAALATAAVLRHGVLARRMRAPRAGTGSR